MRSVRAPASSCRVYLRVHLHAHRVLSLLSAASQRLAHRGPVSYGHAPGSARVRMGNTDVLAAVKAEFSKPFPPGRIGPGPLLFHVDLRGIDGEGTSTVPRDDDDQVEDYAFMVCRTLEVTLEEKY
jgi:hypothetical protein